MAHSSHARDRSVRQGARGWSPPMVKGLVSENSTNLETASRMLLLNASKYSSSMRILSRLSTRFSLSLRVIYQKEALSIVRLFTGGCDPKRLLL